MLRNHPIRAAFPRSIVWTDCCKRACDESNALEVPNYNVLTNHSALALRLLRAKKFFPHPNPDAFIGEAGEHPSSKLFQSLLPKTERLRCLRRFLRSACNCAVTARACHDITGVWLSQNRVAQVWIVGPRSWMRWEKGRVATGRLYPKRAHWGQSSDRAPGTTAAGEGVSVAGGRLRT